jgi:hypothetical protein
MRPWACATCPASAAMAAGSRRVGRLLAVMALLLALVFGGIAWLQAQSLRDAQREPP